MCNGKIPILVGELHPKEVTWILLVMYLEVLLWVVFGGLDICLITLSHKNVIHVDKKND